jgi:RNA polymerase sigma-70 factor (ECF subfamily)
VNEYYAPLFRFARSLTRNASDAADLTQQTFLIWARSGHQLRDSAKAKSWLFTTLYREHLRARRKDACMIPLPMSSEIAESESRPSHTQLDVPAVMAALQALRNDYRAPLVLFYLEDRSYREIAEALSVPIGTVMTRLHRGKRELRYALA